MNLDDEWLTFQTSINDDSMTSIINNNNKNTVPPKCSDIYISTQTKIAYLNSKIDLYTVFWNIPIINYYSPEDGIIKKSIKITCNDVNEVDKLEKKLENIEGLDINILKQVNNPDARKTKFKDIRKIDVGLCKKDLISYRKAKKGAFYNCFALILRIKYKSLYKEVHVKIFNTGKLEIPGIQYDELLTLTLDKLVTILRPLTNDNLEYNSNISTVLINSNFCCGFFIDRFKFYKILKNKYNINAAYDPCSYPGIQCKFYYHPEKQIQDGVKTSNFEENWSRISFMVFRTGSLLIVGNCDKNILNIIYNYLIKVLFDEYTEICIENNNTKKKKSIKKIRKKTVLFTIK